MHWHGGHCCRVTSLHRSLKGAEKEGGDGMAGWLAGLVGRMNGLEDGLSWAGLAGGMEWRNGWAGWLAGLGWVGGLAGRMDGWKQG